MDDNMIPVDAGAEPVANDIVLVEHDISPREQAKYMEEVAKYAPAIKKAQETLLALNTYPSDWMKFGEKMALNSAGAERVARMFPIKISDFVCEGRTDFEDEHGKGYRYVYSCRAELKGRVIYSTGTYSTRDAFLGKSGGQWRPLEDINENDIRMAAYRRCQGNAIRALLGIRNIPVDEWSRIMKQTGQDGSQAASDGVPFASGTKGGTSKGDTVKQKELSEVVYEIVDAGMVCHYDGGNVEMAVNQGGVDAATRDITAKACLLALTQFEGKDGTVKGVTSYKMLRGKRLDVTLSRTKEAWGNFKDQNSD